MTTLVGTQSEFDDAIRELIELEYDAIGAYKLAINKLKNPVYATRLKEFLADHERHIAELKMFYNKELIILPASGDLIKGCLAKLKVALGAIGTDKCILKAMLSNELDTNKAYKRINDQKEAINNPTLTIILKLAYEDEIRHKQWLEDETVTFGNIG